MPTTLYQAEDGIRFTALEDAELHEKVLKSTVGKHYQDTCANDGVRHALRQKSGAITAEGTWIVHAYASHDEKRKDESGPRLGGAVVRVAQGRLVDVLVEIARNGWLKNGGSFYAHTAHKSVEWTEQIKGW